MWLQAFSSSDSHGHSFGEKKNDPVKNDKDNSFQSIAYISPYTGGAGEPSVFSYSLHERILKVNYGLHIQMLR